MINNNFTKKASNHYQQILALKNAVNKLNSQAKQCTVKDPGLVGMISAFANKVNKFSNIVYNYGTTQNFSSKQKSDFAQRLEDINTVVSNSFKDVNPYDDHVVNKIHSVGPEIKTALSNYIPDNIGPSNQTVVQFPADTIKANPPADVVFPTETIKAKPPEMGNMARPQEESAPNMSMPQPNMSKQEPNMSKRESARRVSQLIRLAKKLQR